MKSKGGKWIDENVYMDVDGNIIDYNVLEKLWKEFEDALGQNRPGRYEKNLGGTNEN